ncbi:hypothetical protein GW17_00013130 [Ensete ventricosum]|nr:hypothetical protein GW17_00013130 [Ensete ventricosum]
MRTARYRVVPPKSTIAVDFDRRRSIEGEKGKKKKKKKKKRKRRKKKKRRRNTSCRPRLHAVAARGSSASHPRPHAVAARGSPASRPPGDFSPTREERSKRLDGAAVLGTLVADPQEKRPPAAHRSQRPKRRGRRRGVWSTKERTEGAQDGEGGERATTGVGFRLGFQGLAAVLQ